MQNNSGKGNSDKIKDKVSKGLEKTKETAEKALDKTKDATGKALDTTKEKVDNSKTSSQTGKSDEIKKKVTDGINKATKATGEFLTKAKETATGAAKGIREGFYNATGKMDKHFEKSETASTSASPKETNDK
ncbi:hypothetical protein NEOKW01_1276 [Nematocida sp. AWRm80]|nr:hypothetical protein NEOKW01_1276 [Nematocida sp. AWRm80]